MVGGAGDETWENEGGSQTDVFISHPHEVSSRSFFEENFQVGMKIAQGLKNIW